MTFLLPPGIKGLMKMFPIALTFKEKNKTDITYYLSAKLTLIGALKYVYVHVQVLLLTRNLALVQQPTILALFVASYLRLPLLQSTRDIESCYRNPANNGEDLFRLFTGLTIN